MRTGIGRAGVCLGLMMLLCFCGCQWRRANPAGGPANDLGDSAAGQEWMGKGVDDSGVAGESEAVVMSLLGKPLRGAPPGDMAKLEADLAEAREVLERRPGDADSWIWVGRRLGYLWRMEEAVEVFTRGMERFPEDARFLRHRGHRYISLRRFDEAIADLTRAAEMMGDEAYAVEPDGKPNARNLPLTTLGYNVWYHLGVAYYLTADFEKALDAFSATGAYGRGLDDNVVSTTDWMYLCLRRLGRTDEARRVLRNIGPDMDIVENHAYYRRLLMYKGLLRPEALEVQMISDLDTATLGYGLGMWYWLQGNPLEGKEMFERVVSGRYWPAFGYVAAEVELARAGASE